MPSSDPPAAYPRGADRPVATPKVNESLRGRGSLGGLSGRHGPLTKQRTPIHKLLAHGRGSLQPLDEVSPTVCSPGQ